MTIFIKEKIKPTSEITDSETKPGQDSDNRALQ